MRSVVPAPACAMDGVVRRSRSRATPDAVADLLHTAPGFVWLDGNDSRHLFFSNPIATISCGRDEAIVAGLGGSETLSNRSMDVLDAALRAWRGASHAMLVGCISYDVVEELENVGR